MRKNNWMVVILVLSLFGNVSLYMNQIRMNRVQTIRYELLNANINRDLAQLELMIRYQEDNNWDNETLVTQQLDDAIASIILRIGMEKDDDKRELLRKLHDYLNMFKAGDGPPDISLNDSKRADFIHLGNKLRSFEWTLDVWNETNWDAFAAKVRDFVR